MLHIGKTIIKKRAGQKSQEGPLLFRSSERSNNDRSPRFERYEPGEGKDRRVRAHADNKTGPWEYIGSRRDGHIIITELRDLSEIYEP